MSVRKCCAAEETTATLHSTRGMALWHKAVGEIHADRVSKHTEIECSVERGNVCGSSTCGWAPGAVQKNSQRADAEIMRADAENMRDVQPEGTHCVPAGTDSNDPEVLSSARTTRTEQGCT